MLHAARKNPSAILLFVQLGGVLVYPFLEEGAAGRAIFSAFGIGVLALAVLAVRSTPTLTWVSLLLALPATVLLVIQAVGDHEGLLPYSSGLEAVLYFYAAWALVRYMLADHVITTDELFAVGATFTLAAWGFAYTYQVVQAIYPESFFAALNPRDARTWMELLYLSFTTLTGTGLSDVVPVKAFARAVVMLEQLMGLGYVAMLVSRLVAQMVINRQGETEAG